MKLGLLQCDARPFPKMFAAWMPDVEWEVYPVYDGVVPEDLRQCDGWVSTGSKSSVYDDEPWIHRFANLVRQMDIEEVPFVGVCFGHQMIGHALGGRVAKSPNGWCVGVHQFAITQQEDWMVPSVDNCAVLMSCQDQILELPDGAEVLASGDACPVGMVRVGTLWGIQGHPEFPIAYAAELLDQRRERIGAAKVAEAEQSLIRNQEIQREHSQVLAAWVRNFVADLK